MKDWFLHIEEYLTDQLNQNDKTAFEEEMKTNTSLSEAVQNFEVGKSISMRFVEAEVTDLLSELRSEKEEEKKPKNIFNLRRIIGVAASVLLIGFVGLLWYSNKYYSDEALIAEYLEPLINEGERGVELSDDPIKRGIQLYHLNRLEESLVTLTPFEHTANSEVLEVLIYCNIKLKNYRKAEELSKVKDNVVSENTISLLKVLNGRKLKNGNIDKADQWQRKIYLFLLK